MENKDIIKSLKQLKNLQSAGVPKDDFVAKNREILLMQINNSSQQTEKSLGLKYAWGVFESLMPHNMFRFVVRPVMTALLIFGIAFGGWAATISASYNSLPGDTLYPVKRITEKAQLTITPKKAKTSLQTELAGRRLEEISKIAEKPTINNKEERTKKAVKEFTAQVKEVKNTLEDLENNAKEGEETATIVEAAKLVDRKTTEYNDVLKKATEDFSGDIQKDVEEATDAVHDAGIKAVAVIVKKQEEGAIDISEEEVINKVSEKLKIVQEQVDLLGESANTEESETDAGVEGATKEAQAVLDEAQEAFENNDLSQVVDKIVEAKNLVNTAVPEDTEEPQEDVSASSTPLDEGSTEQPNEATEDNNSSSSTEE